MDEKEILEQAKKDFLLSLEAEKDIRKEAEEDLKFRLGEQWIDTWKQIRENDKRPCLTINRIPQFIRQVTNDQRMNKPSIRVVATDDSTIDQAEIFEGIIRHIQESSDASIAYDTACENQVTFGFGYIKIITDYCDPLSFNQEIKIKRVKDAFSVYFDPNCKEPDYSDATFCFYVENISKEKFKELFPNKSLSLSDFFAGEESQFANWVSENTIKIAEYWKVEEKPVKIFLLSNGEIVTKEQLPPELKKDKIYINPETLETITIVKERESSQRKIMCYRMTAQEILESFEWAGSYIPFIPVLGDDFNLNGKRTISGLTRYAKEPQRVYNYMVSAQAEAIALAPKAPFIGAVGQFEGVEDQWSNITVSNRAFVEYNPIDINGVAVGAPLRQTFEPPIQAITIALQQSSQDLKNTTGIYDASLGNRSNETSGVAIRSRQQESDVANYHYIDNLSRSIKFVGVQLVDLIPKIYDVPRIVNILHPNQESELIKINEIFQDKNGQPKIYDLSKGKYDIVIETGPSYSTKRIEAAQTILELTRANPQIWQIAGDIIASNMDLAGAKDLAQRFKRALPPELLEDADNEKALQTMKAQVQQYQMLVDNLTKHLNELLDENQIKTAELQSRERIALEDNKTKIIIKEMDNNKALAEMELGHIKNRISDLSTREIINDHPY